jgi:membrane-associated phospholipid phosphatase
MVLITAVLTLALSGPTQAPQAGSPPASQQQQAEPQGQRAEAQEKAEPQEKKADAQEPPTPPHTGIRALFGNLGEDIKNLPAMQNVYIAAIGGGLALAAHPADQAFNAKLLSHYDAVNAFFAPGKYLGNTPEQVAFSIVTYAVGRLRDQPKVAHLGMDLLQAQILSEILVEPIKYAVRRERPDGSDNRSFPSGHASVTFATATVIERHLGWRKSILGYAIASYVAMSRIHDNKHYLSDVIFGAAVGTIAGRTVVHHQADYWAFTPVAMPGGGVALMVSRTKWDR